MANAEKTYTTLQHRISRECVVTLQFVGPVTQEAIYKLRALLKAQRDTYPTQEELDKEPKGAE